MRLRGVVGTSIAILVLAAGRYGIAGGAPDSSFWQVITPSTFSSNGTIVVATSDIGANAVVDVYPADDPSQACVVDVATANQLVLPTSATAPCGKLVGKLLDGSIAGLAYKVHGKSQISLLHLAVTSVRDPATHAELGEKKLDLKAISAKADCYLVLPDIVALKGCNNPEVPDNNSAAFAALKQALKRGDKPFLIANVSDADSVAGTWQRVPITLKKPDETGDQDGAATDFVDRCKAAIKAARGRLDNRYVVCADVYAGRQSLLVSDCDDKADECKAGGENVRTNRAFTVFAWTDKGNTPKVTLDGIAGSSSGIYEKPASENNKGTPPTGEKPTVWEFGARKAGQAKLAVIASKSKEGGGTTEVARIDYPFTVEDVFNILPRLGLGFSYQPSGAVVGITSTNDGQRYSTLTRGPGTFNLEILAGMSYMLTPIRQNSHDFSAGLGLRVGLASLNGDPKLLTSVMGGLEIGFGVDIAIGLYMGVARNDAPDNNYEVGKLIPPMVNGIPTHMVARQSFALVIDFMPSVSKSMGLAK
jgi:hypothetical protein